MIIIDKRYTIKYSKSGIYQYADFSYVEDKLVHHTFNPNYVNTEEVPSINSANNIEDILMIVKNFSYCNRAEIYKINGVFPEYYHNTSIKEYFKDSSVKFNKFIGEMSLEFFDNYIIPILTKNKWKISRSWAGYPVIISKLKKEWCNVDSQNKDYKLIEFISFKFLQEIMDNGNPIKDNNETGYYSSDNFAIFLKFLPENYLKKSKFYVHLQ
jgi:hypothetical protein